MKLDQLPPAMQAQAAALLPGLAPSLDERVDAARKAVARKNAKNDGREFQAEMEKTAGAYQSRRLATLRKVDPPVRLIWIDDKANPGKKTTRAIFMVNPHLDYVGVWRSRGGRALMIEAKSTSAHRLPFNGDSGLKAHQVANIGTWHASGAAVALVWRFGDRACLWTAPMVEAAVASGAKSLAFDAGLKVPPGEGTVVWDFLPVLEKALYPTPNRCEIVYLGVGVYHEAGGWWIDGGKESAPFQTVEKALEAVDDQREKKYAT